MEFRDTFAAAAFLGLALSSPAWSTPVYLNQSNITVAVGSGTSAGTFNNTFANGATITKVIDAPSAAAEEFHDQATHIWFSADNVGGGLELRFDFQIEYDITTLHFWNYTSESYDVDNILFTFFNGANLQVGTLGIQPNLGSSPGIRAQDIELPAPLNVRYVTAFLAGSNGEVDFQNIGFTAEASQTTDPVEVPEPTSLALLGLGLAGAAMARRRRKR